MPHGCTHVTDACPVSLSFYQYAPNLGANAFFLAFWILILIVQLALNVRYKTWTFFLAFFLCAGGEIAGFGGRVAEHFNVYNNTAFKDQIATLIFAPAFLSAACYLTLKHITMAIDPSLSRLKPAMYTWLFVSADIAALVLQAVGGGLAASSIGSTKANAQSTANLGGYLSLGGVACQAFTLGVFSVLMVEYLFRANRKIKYMSSVHDSQLSYGASRIAWPSVPGFKWFIVALLSADLLLMVRCLYRVAELSHGWANNIVYDEVVFIIFDNAVTALAAVLLTVAYPGWFLPTLSLGRKNVKSESQEKFREQYV